MKLAQYKDLEHGFISYCDEDFESIEAFVRISEFAEVTFVPLAGRASVLKEVNALKKLKTRMQAKAEVELNEVQDRINKLLALPQL